jgi:diguanylate cyclase (GGDEF)-like protein
VKPNSLTLFRVLRSLEVLPRAGVTLIAGGIVIILGVIDYVTGFELSFSFFYLIPVTMAAWALGRTSGLTFSLLSATMWLAANLLSGWNFSSGFVGVWNTLLRFGFYAVTTFLLTELRHALEKERNLANTDPLTGALNRRSFNEIAENKMIASEVGRRPYTMVYIDLDNFKNINDLLGHATGDVVLRSVVDTIRDQIRGSDFIARLGGDEFAILLTDTDRDHAQPIVERLQACLLETMKAKEWEITFSIGVLTVLRMPPSVDVLVSLTDALMYDVKAHGKNAIRYSVLE